MERELWRILYHLTRESDKPWGEWRYATADVLAAYFWAVVHDRPTRWAADPKHWPDDLRPALLPPQSTISRRLRRPRTVELMTAVEERLLALIVVGRWLVQIIDGKPLAVSGVSKDSDGVTAAVRAETRRAINSTPCGAAGRCRSLGAGTYERQRENHGASFDSCLAGRRLSAG